MEHSSLSSFILDHYLRTSRKEEFFKLEAMMDSKSSPLFIVFFFFFCLVFFFLFNLLSSVTCFVVYNYRFLVIDPSQSKDGEWRDENGRFKTGSNNDHVVK